MRAALGCSFRRRLNEDCISFSNRSFWAIAGGANGGVVDFNQLARGVPVGSNNIVASAIYLEGGGNGGEPGVSIDAFDVNQGIFVDDDFVNVSPDASLTAPRKAFSPMVRFTRCPSANGTYFWELK